MLLRPYSYEIEAKEYPGQILNGQTTQTGINIGEKPIMDNATDTAFISGKWGYVVRPLEGW